MDSRPLDQVLRGTPWCAALAPDELQLVLRSSAEKTVRAGEYIVRAGDPAAHWFGMIDGLVQMYVIGADGRDTTLAWIPPGTWCGEGSLLKRERLRYHAVALRPSRIALLPLATFEHLRATNLGFNHYLQDLLNARMSMFIAALEAERILSPERKVAQMMRRLADALEEGPGLGQRELARLCGLSRQRTNAALRGLEAAGMIAVSFQNILVRDGEALRRCAEGEADLPSRRAPTR